MDYVKTFLQIREILLQELALSMNIYFCDIWDPLCEFQIMKETNKLVNTSLIKQFPNFPPKFFPNFKFKRDVDTFDPIGIMIQEYFNDHLGLNYIGSCVVDEHPYDMYIRNSYGLGLHMFVVKYGHDSSSITSGGEQAEVEYSKGMITPLAMAYQLALDEGYF
jgi:hypothetical protein